MATQEIKKDNLVIASIRVARPVHWVKNLAVFAALLLTGELFDHGMFENSIIAFISFCLVTSATYILNDILDVKNDRLHPTKKYRPIASGALPIPLAIVELVILAVLSLLLAMILDTFFFILVAGYIVLQVAYSFGLKNIAVLDIILIAAGFIIRIYAGGFAINAHLSVWFLLCVISVALFLASGKRRAELNVVGRENGQTRKSLGNYNRELLNSFVTMFGNASWMSWALYTFFESPKAALPFWLALAELSKTTTVDKLLMLTIPITIFGIMRYESLIFEDRSETPERLLLTDKSLIIAVGLWIAVVYWILYSGISNAAGV